MVEARSPAEPYRTAVATGAQTIVADTLSRELRFELA